MTATIKPALLMLVHRIPYPPNKGDKIRSFNLLKNLSQQYRIYLACFVDDPYDEQYIGELNHWCAEVCCIRLSKKQAMLRGLTAFISNKAVTLPYYYDAAMQRWINSKITQQHISQVLVYSSAMAQYVQDKPALTTKVIDFVDIDSDKWLQYSRRSQGIKRWFYRREARLLQRYEIEICQQFNKSLFVSEDEASAFRQLLPKMVHSKVHSLSNGVDIEYFDPLADLPDAELKLPADYLVFTGAMDYWANVDAVCWFCREVWPTLRQHYPRLHFLIVGGNPHADVKALSQFAGVIVTGRVADVRPYLHAALFAVAPMLIARGIQNKVLEAMAMNKAVICTPMAMEGINAPLTAHTQIADNANSFTALCLSMLATPSQNNVNRQWVIQHFSWQYTLSRLSRFITAEAA
uniref:TIGR03087 family PEP-CTERM/XrtA system glycosyltransferase n=1 Tax=Rheinheimera sp. TaxID=1869214 RepID=UPI0040489114